jgi:hypothetical protein
MELCSVRAGRMLCVVDVEDIVSSLNVFGPLRYLGAVARGFFAGNHFERRTRRKESPPRSVVE